ncbi:MAG: CHAT domain-containing protein [Bacteroidia bacterium]|nr:CHAT domain-containing protein [Bacteroidia bacterium]
MFVYKQELDRLIAILKTNNPLYYQSFFDSSFITISNVRENLLKNHTAITEIFLGDTAVYSLIITFNNVYFNKINKDRFVHLSKEYSNFISNPSLLNINFSAFINISSELYQLIFGEVVLPPGRIIISPDGHNFPFEALVVKKQPVTYFLNDYAVSYTYSARYLLNNFVSYSNSFSKNFMGVAPLQYGYNTQLPALRGADNSLMRIGANFTKKDNLISNKATRNNFLTAYNQYKIIQLYSHASDSSNYGEPVIYFSDSALYLSDLIGDVKPATELIVLSACETGTGKLYQGEGVFSFNRGFAALGIPSAITNLWSVDNESTYRITELFYKYLTQGLPTDVALQKAKLEFIKNFFKATYMPYYWAASVLAGKADAIQLTKPFPWKWMIVITGVVVIAFMGWKTWKPKTKQFTPTPDTTQTSS